MDTTRHGHPHPTHHAFLALGAAAACALCPALARADDSGDRQSPRHRDILIADQFNNRVIEIDPRTHAAVRQFGDGSDTPGPHSIVGVDDAECIASFTLMSGTGIPPATPPLPGCSDAVNGCPDNRVLLVDRRGRIVWQYATNTDPGSHPDPLPTRAVRLRDGDTLISDQFNERVVEATPTFRVAFAQGALDMHGNGSNRLNGPYDAKLVGDFTGMTPPSGFDA